MGVEVTLVKLERGPLAEVAKAQAMVHGAKVELARALALASSDLPRALKIKASERAKAIGEAMAKLSKTLEHGKALALDAADLIYDADKGRAILEAEDKRDRGRPKKSDTHVAITKAEQKAIERRAPLATVPKEIEHDVPITTHAVAEVARIAKTDPRRAKQVIAKLGDKPEIKAALGAVKLAAKRKLAEEIRANPMVTPDGRYQVIAIDPPWKYDNRAEDTTHRGKNLYPEMTVDEICALPVAKLAQPSCVLWLWTTNAHMRNAYKCLDAWGFEEKTILTWNKEIMGLGDWLRNITEHCILAVRGKPLVDLTNETTLIHERRREHSRKPLIFYSLVEKLCPGSKLEMFARESREGWSAWGAEKEKFDAAE